MILIPQFIPDSINFSCVTRKDFTSEPFFFLPSRIIFSAISGHLVENSEPQFEMFSLSAKFFWASSS